MFEGQGLSLVFCTLVENRDGNFEKPNLDFNLFWDLAAASMEAVFSSPKHGWFSRRRVVTDRM